MITVLAVALAVSLIATGVLYHTLKDAMDRLSRAYQLLDDYHHDRRMLERQLAEYHTYDRDMYPNIIELKDYR
jgi:hypothetical protein